MDLPLPPADADFIHPERECNSDSRRFTWAEIEYNVRLTRAKELHAAESPDESPIEGTPVRDGFAKMFDLLK
jgi:hypothetical protein